MRILGKTATSEPQKTQAEAPAPARYPRQAPAGLTSLQRHVAFFDLDGDGYVRPDETAMAFKDLGLPGPLGMWRPIARGILDAQAQLINKRADALQLPGFQPVTGAAIPIKDIGLGKHDSDTDSYRTNTGDFDQAAFDAAFAKADRNGSGALDLTEILRAAWARRESGTGLAASVGEFGLLWAIGSDVSEPRLGGWMPSRSALSRQRVMETIKGNGFYEIANDRAAKVKK